MKNKAIGFLLFVMALVSASSCNKCYECTQYCAYCETTSGVRIKTCATKGVNNYKIDSVFTAYKAAGYTCNMLENAKNVCDQPGKINDAVNYYYKQDYYCNEKQ